MDYGVMILGHLVGDYLLQTDWMAANKTNSSLVCTVHCIVYTLAVATILTASGSVLPLLAYVIIGVTHFALDRWRLAYRMMQYTGHRNFAAHLHPWSTILYDNILHLLVLFGLYLFFV